MNKMKLIKLSGLIAALATGLVSALTGDMLTAVGIIAAALSSSTALSREQK